MFVELSVMEQRYHAVMEVLAGAPVTEVAARYGVSRQAVHTWLARYPAGWAGRAGRPVASAARPARSTPRSRRWSAAAARASAVGAAAAAVRAGPAGVLPVPSRSTIYRVLVRNGLVAARQRKRRREDYKRWERAAPMELWQLDIIGGVPGRRHGGEAGHRGG